MSIWAILGGWLLGAGGVYLAPRTAALHVALRYTYLLHYVALAGVSSLGLLLPMADLLPAGPGQQIGSLLIFASPAWVYAHLLASGVSMRRWSWYFGALGALWVMIPAPFSTFSVAGIPINPALYALVMAAVLGTGWAGSVPQKPAEVESGSFTVTSYILFNLVAAASLGVALLAWFWHIWQSGMAGDGMAPPLWEQLTTPQGDGPSNMVLLAMRWCGAIFASAAAFAFVFARGQSEDGTFHIQHFVAGLSLSAALLAVTAGFPAGLAFPGLWLLLAVFGGAFLGFAFSSALMPLRRAARVPLAFLAAALAASGFFNIAEPATLHPLWSGMFWVPEAIALAIVWLPAYLLGIRQLRRLQDDHWQHGAQGQPARTQYPDGDNPDSEM